MHAKLVVEVARDADTKVGDMASAHETCSENT